jgi:hypothetical protein
MPDPKHLELLLDCDRYLERQQALLDRLAGDDALAPLLAAMDAAFDQLLQAVTEGWHAAGAGAEPPRTE